MQFGFRRLEAGRQVRRHGEHKDGAAADGSGNGGDEGLASGKPGWDGNDHVSSAYSSIGQQKELEAFGIREKMQRFLRFLQRFLLCSHLDLYLFEDGNVISVRFVQLPASLHSYYDTISPTY